MQVAGFLGRFHKAMAVKRVGLERVVEAADAVAVWSHQSSWKDLFVSVNIDAGRVGLDLRDGWMRRWAVSWRADGDEASCSVQDLVHEPALSGDPMRHFTCGEHGGRPGPAGPGLRR